MFVTFGDGNIFPLKRSDSHYAMLFVIFDDKKILTLQENQIQIAPALPFTI
jgi:hypothetical protein